MEQFSLVMETGGIGSQQWRQLPASAEPIVCRAGHPAIGGMGAALADRNPGRRL
jgi:hypothetical protein